ncbi:ATPase MipZ [Pigmentiphaga humi]|uniref:ATPase MipZ n=1 Tax=Pigmentiphaga humi TaxID=2478468 RepID=A0A3P4BAL2_9BURK|nr:AAA family ATPase [Pigmentiphaga humi]VCU72155.1 ATPase MipZ [Pigmentiphaga humi]
MARIVCVLGNKGGTGKTTLSHMIAHGMALLGKRVVCVLTDLERERLSKAGRLYLPFDAREAANLAKVVATLNEVEDWFGVIDGAGNRPDVDSHLANLADLVLLPFRDSHEDLRTVLRDLEWMPRAWGLPSQWPQHAAGRAAAQASIDRLLPGMRHRLLDPIPEVLSSKLFLQYRIPATLPWQLTNACVELAMQVLELLDVQYESPHAIEVAS